MNNFLYGIVRVLAFPVINICLMPRVYGRQYLKVSHKCIVIANHTTYWDPLLVGFLVHPKNTHFMAKAELIRKGFAKKFLLGMGIVPVERGTSDLKAIKTSIKVLRNDEVLGIFPEGTRSKTGELLDFESGVSVLASKTDTPVLPIYIHKNGIHFGKRVKVAVGRPVDLRTDFGEIKTNEQTEKATEYLRGIMLSLKKEIADE